MKGKTVGFVTVLVVVLAAAMAVHGQPATFGKATDRIALGYYLANSDLQLADVPWTQLTHVAHAYLELDEQGKIVAANGIPGPEVPAAAHAHGLQAMLSLGGRQSVGRFEQVASDDARRAEYVRQVMAAVNQHGYDGVDLEWLSPRSEESGTGFSKLVRELRQGLDALDARRADGKKLLLSAAVSAGVQAHFGKWIDADVLRENCDFLNVLAYDMAGPWSRYAGHQSPLFPSPGDPERRWRNVKYAIQYWHRRKGIPKEKLCLGVACYGRSFPTNRPFKPLDAKHREKHGVIAFSHIRTLIDEGWVARWDHDAHVPWLFSPNGKEVVAFDDRNSVYRKATWAREEKLGGMYFWALHQDRMVDQKNWLVSAAIRAWPK